MNNEIDFLRDVLKKDEKEHLHLYEKSVTTVNQNTYFLLKKSSSQSQPAGSGDFLSGKKSEPFAWPGTFGQKTLGIFSVNKDHAVASGFEPFKQLQIVDAGSKSGWLAFCPADSKNLSALTKMLPNLSPSPLKTAPSFGFGDRLGIANPGHIRAVNKFRGILPVFAQQSIRELIKTKRNYRDVIDSSAWSVFQEGYKGKWGADADHLKYEKDLLDAIKSGCTMFTIDTSEYLNEEPFNLKNGNNESTENKVKDHSSCEGQDYLKNALKRYSGKKIKKDNYCLQYNDDNVTELFLVYNRAIDFVSKIYSFIKENTGDFDFEVSFDETKTVTSPEAHYFIANELASREIDFTSLALKFPGEFFKGIDYIGNLGEFKEAILVHGDIAKIFGSYKMSLHSGSDKFSVYPDFFKYTSGNFHVKTSGTSWLEALNVISKCNPSLFRKIYGIAYNNFELNKKDYHLVLKKSELPESIAGQRDKNLQELLFDSRIRQCLHISYGTILDNLGEQLYSVLNDNEEMHYNYVCDYLEKHLDLLS